MLPSYIIYNIPTSQTTTKTKINKPPSPIMLNLAGPDRLAPSTQQTHICISKKRELPHKINEQVRIDAAALWNGCWLPVPTTPPSSTDSYEHSPTGRKQCRKKMLCDIIRALETGGTGVCRSNGNGVGVGNLKRLRRWFSWGVIGIDWIIRLRDVTRRHAKFEL